MAELDFALTGYSGSGKSVAGDYLEDVHGFLQLNGGDFLQQAANELGVTLETRQHYADFQLWIRQTKSASFIADLGLAIPGERAVNVGMRNRYDVDKFLEEDGVLIAIDTDSHNRFDRSAGTNPKYPTDFDAFLKADLLEDSPEAYGSHVKYAMDKATHVINNNGDIDELYAKLDDIVDLYT